MVSTAAGGFDEETNRFVEPPVDFEYFVAHPPGPTFPGPAK